MSRILLAVFLISTVSCNKTTIKGKQYVRHSTTARLIGGPIPREMFEVLGLNSSEGAVSPVPSPPLGGVPTLITEDVKTVLTRMSIPLNSSSDEQYMTKLKKFLINNKINLLENSKDSESFGDVAPGIPAIENRMQQALVFSENLQSIIYDVLKKNSNKMPKGNHPALSHIFRLLQLRRIPVIDLVELGEELSIQTVQEQWVTILIEIEHLIPQYMRSCVTFLLEGLQVEGSLKMSDLLTASQMKYLLKNVNVKKTSPLKFPKQLLLQVPPTHIEELGESTAALLTTVRDQMTPKLLQLFLRITPRNSKPSQEENKLFTKMDQRQASDTEKKIVSKATRKAFEDFQKPPSQLLKTILAQITQSDFEGVDDYKTMQRLFQTPRENYIVS